MILEIKHKHGIPIVILNSPKGAHPKFMIEAEGKSDGDEEGNNFILDFALKLHGLNSR
jgi:hypothetical protein